MASAQQQQPSGVFCSTSGTYFSDKETLTEHYRSDFHRYNLKRKVAGLPPVTKEWFEERKAQLSLANTSAAQKFWTDPLTKKRFNSENTYLAHVRSNKYKEFMKKQGLEDVPAPVITIRKSSGKDAPAVAGGAGVKPSGFTLKPAVKHTGGQVVDGQVREVHQAEDSMSNASEDSGFWETASDEDDTENKDWKDWDVCRSLFDSHVSSSLQDNLEYMYKKYGFYLPEAEYLRDAEGLIKYLGAKMQYGHMSLAERGDNPNAKQFRSVHAVQRHMIDTNQCRMLYEGNEEEYAEWYEGSDMEEDEPENATGGDIVVADDGAGASGSGSGYELIITAKNGSTKILGSREFARYYRQRHRRDDGRPSVEANSALSNSIVVRYAGLGIGTKRPMDPEIKAKRKALQQQNKLRLKNEMKNAIIFNLPKNEIHKL